MVWGIDILAVAQVLVFLFDADERSQMFPLSYGKSIESLHVLRPMIGSPFLAVSEDVPDLEGTQSHTYQGE